MMQILLMLPDSDSDKNKPGGSEHEDFMEDEASND